MKIAVIASKEKQSVLFNKRGWDKLNSLGEVVLNDGEPNVENVKKTIKDADIAITSWGNVPMTEDRKSVV